MRNKGFTLIELIIVIAILAILMAGLIVTVDPQQQLARARDNNRRRAAIEINSALVRYFSLNTSFPWGTNASALPAEDSGFIATLVTTGDLSYKYSSEIGRTPYTGLTVSTESVPAGGRTWVCFDPESRAASRESLTMYASPGSGTCDPGTSDSCYYCAE